MCNCTATLIFTITVLKVYVTMWLPYLVGETQTQNEPLLVVSAGLDYAIPKGTAYELSASSNAASDNVTYSWEQLDSGQITASNFGPYNAAGAMARSLPPSSSPL